MEVRKLDELEVYLDTERKKLEEVEIACQKLVCFGGVLI